MRSFFQKLFKRRPLLFKDPAEAVFHKLRHSSLPCHFHAPMVRKVLETYEKHKSPAWADLKDIINRQDESGNTLLHYFGSEMDDYLIEKGARADIVNKAGLTPLAYNIGRVSERNKALIMAEKDINAVTRHGETLLFHLLKTKSNHTGLLTLLLEKGVDLNKGCKGASPLGLVLADFLERPFQPFRHHGHADKEFQETVDFINACFLQKNGARLNAEESKKAVQALSVFCDVVSTRKNAFGIEALTATALLSADVLAPDTKIEDESLFLHGAVKLDSFLKTMENTQFSLLFKELSGLYYYTLAHKCARLDTPDKNGLTPLQSAFKQGNWLYASCLINAGADISLLNQDKQTFLHQAVLADNVQLTAQLLKTDKIDVNAQDINLNTALHLTDNEKIADMLVQYGANPDIQNNKGETVLDDVPNIQIALILSNRYRLLIRQRAAKRLQTAIKRVNQATRA